MRASLTAGRDRRGSRGRGAADVRGGNNDVQTLKSGWTVGRDRGRRSWRALIHWEGLGGLHAVHADRGGASSQ